MHGHKKNQGLHTSFPTISTTLVKELELLDGYELPDYVDDSDFLGILDCGRRHSAYYQDLDYVIRHRYHN
jgi:hypothetical protein